MGSFRRVVLVGFEEALAKYIAENFRFSGDTLQNVPLVEGRNIFVQDMPEVEELAQTFTDFSIATEPTLALYTDPGEGALPGVSGTPRHEWNLRFVLRLGTVPEETKMRLEELVAWMERNTQGRIMGRFQVKKFLYVSRPTVFERAGDDHAFVSSVLRFIVVPLPQ